MLNREVFSRVACFTVCAFLLFGVTFIGSTSGRLDVSAPGLKPQPQPTQTTSPLSTTKSTPDVALPETTNEATNGTFIVLIQEANVNVGDTFLVSMFAENVSDMYAWQVILFFDPTIAECLNASVPNQNVFSDRISVSRALMDFNSTEFPNGPLQSVQNEDGYMLTGDCLLGVGQQTFSGSGFLCEATFKALSSGSSNLAFSRAGNQPFNTFYLDEELNKIVPSFSNNSIIVLP